jgi:hypothetical protein
LRFAYKTFKNRLTGDFLPCKLRRTEASQEPDNRDFLYRAALSPLYAKNPQAQQAPGGRWTFKGIQVKIKNRVV